MAEKHNYDVGKVIVQWIVSLAISIICCSLFFWIFADYKKQLDRDVTLLKAKWEMLNARQYIMSVDLEKLKQLSLPIKNDIDQPVKSDMNNTQQPLQQ